MGQKKWNISSFMNLVKYCTINKFYETMPVIANKKGNRNEHLGLSKKKHWHIKSCKFWYIASLVSDKFVTTVKFLLHKKQTWFVTFCTLGFWSLE